jgi:hypothetical protein
MGETSSKTQVMQIIRDAASSGNVRKFRELATAVGIDGRRGGWIYFSDTATKPICQGWQKLASDLLVSSYLPWERKLIDAMAAIVEADTVSVLNFWPAAGVSGKLLAEGATVYEATAEGVTYRVIGRIAPGQSAGRRSFRAYRVVGTNGHSLVPAGRGGEHPTRRGAMLQAARDLQEVLADRAATTPEQQAHPSVETIIDGSASRQLVARFRSDPYSFSGSRSGIEQGLRALKHRIQTDHGLAINEAIGRQAYADRPDHLHMQVTPSGARKIAGAVRRNRALHGRSCCASTDGDVHDRSCQTDEARRQWGPRSERPAPGSDHPVARAHLDAPCTDACYELVATPEPAAADPATEDDVSELVARIVRRAQYDALRAVLSVLDGWVEGMARNCEELHEGTHPVDDCSKTFHVRDIRAMVGDAARHLGTVAPPEAKP